MAKRKGFSRPGRVGLLVANGAGALVATGFAGAGLARPSIADLNGASEPSAVTNFWAASSAFRTWAITGPLLFSLMTRHAPSPQLVAAAGMVQLGDAVLGLRQRNVFMSVAPAVMGVIHLVTARALSRSSGTERFRQGRRRQP